MNRILDIIDSEQSEMDKLEELLAFIKGLEKKYGYFCYENNVLVFVDNQMESEYMRQARRINSIDYGYIAEKQTNYTDKVVNALEKEYRDRRILASFMRKVNSLPIELKGIFVLRMMKNVPVNKVKERFFLSNKRYYQYYEKANSLMIRKMCL